MPSSQSLEINYHEQEIDSSTQTCRPTTSASQSTKFESSEDPTYAEPPSSIVASDDIAMILPPNTSNNFDKVHMLNNAFRPVGEAAKEFDFKKCCTAKGQRFRYLNENHFKTYSWLVFSKSQKGLYCKYCAILYLYEHDRLEYYKSTTIEVTQFNGEDCKIVF